MAAPGEEFAEEYTQAERVRLVLIGVLAGALMVAVGKLWLFPWLIAAAHTAPCRAVYGAFAGIPALAALVTLATFGVRGRRILRDGQYPPRGSKVLRPTRIVRGAQAKRIGWLHLAAVLPFLALLAWGLMQAAALAGGRAC